MNIIFLDFDGVLNFTDESRVEGSIFERSLKINQNNVDVLKNITQILEAKIVISSTWRKDPLFIEDSKNKKEIIDKFLQLFKNHGWENAPVIDITPNLSGFRGQEVAQYLDDLSNDKVKYIILDDDKDFFIDKIENYSIIKLDRVGIRSIEEAKEKSVYWSNQNLYQINPKKGLSSEDTEKIIEQFCIQDISVKSLKIRV